MKKSKRLNYTKLTIEEIEDEVEALNAKENLSKSDKKRLSILRRFLLYKNRKKDLKKYPVQISFLVVLIFYLLSPVYGWFYSSFDLLIEKYYLNMVIVFAILCAIFQYLFKKRYHIRNTIFVYLAASFLAPALILLALIRVNSFSAESTPVNLTGNVVFKESKRRGAKHIRVATQNKLELNLYITDYTFNKLHLNSKVKFNLNQGVLGFLFNEYESLEIIEK